MATKARRLCRRPCGGYTVAIRRRRIYVTCGVCGGSGPFDVSAARTLPRLGAIDLDPASHAEANRIVRARRFYSEKQNGLRRPWRGRVFINPPGGLVPAFWCRLMLAWHLREIRSAIWIGYSLEQLQTLQGHELEDLPRVSSPIEF